VITARRTRLVRVPDLHEFRRVISTLSAAPEGPVVPVVIVPTRGAARQLERSIENAPARLLTREQLYDVLHARLPNAPRRLDAFERDSLAQAAAEQAARDVPDLSLRLRPGLVAEMLRFYDELRRHSQSSARFETLIVDALAGAAEGGDRGADRLLQQTRLLAGTFRVYERRLASLGACDEHGLRDLLIARPIAPPVGRVVVATADWIADPDGLCAADFDLLARMPGIEAIDIVCTEAILGSGFYERLHQWWPGIDETDGTRVAGPAPRARPVLLTPPDAPPDRPWFIYRDREEELIAVARRAKPRTAVVFSRPLPYLYLAPAAFGAIGVAFQASDALPLAAEPTAAALDLVLEVAETKFARGAIVALLRSPHFTTAGGSDRTRSPNDSDSGAAVSRTSVNALDKALSDARYLGDLGRLETLAAGWPGSDRDLAAAPALDAALDVCRSLTPLLEPKPASAQIRLVLAFLDDRLRPLADADPFSPRERRGRAAIVSLLAALARAHEAHHDPLWTIDDLASALRRWIGDETFVPETAAPGAIQLLDDRAARFGEFDELAIVGLVEQEWPDLPRANIFYPAAMLRALGWPPEKDRRGAADARFVDLLASAVSRVTVSTFTLDEDALVAASPQLDEIPRAGLSTVTAETEHGGGGSVGLPPPHKASADRRSLGEGCQPDQILDMSGVQDAAAREWAEMRRTRPPADRPAFHGSIGSVAPRTWSVSALETYVGCPFKFFAQHVLKLEEEPDDEEVMDPRRQGRFVHEVFEAFFRTWQAAGYGAIRPDNLDEARTVFERVVDEALDRLPGAEAGLERTRLLGSPAAAGLGEAVFRMEAERPIAVVERLLEHTFEGRFVVATASGTREVALRGKADRVDLLDTGTFRMIDYKLGWPPDRNRALQLPIYSVCAEQRLASYRGKTWLLGEALYLAFKGPKRVVSLFTSPRDRDKVLAKAQQRLADTLDAIERGEFPPAPDDVYRCETCSFASVCRKDYVGDV